MPPPVFRYDFLIAALEKMGIHHLERLPSGNVRWGDQPMSKPYRGFSLPTAPVTGDPNATQDRVLFDMWTVESILNKFGKSMGEFTKIYFAKEVTKDGEK
jgi:hypothetical protein